MGCSLVQGMRRFPVRELPSPGCPVLMDRAESHHLLRVVGIAPGEGVVLFDGRGRSCHAALDRVEEGRARLRWTESLPQTLSSDFWLLMAVVRPKAFSSAVRMGTEIGVGHIVPVSCERSLSRGEKAARWERLAESAAAQCGRSDIPSIHPVLSPGAALELAGVPGVVLACGAPALEPGAAAEALWIGPEGGLAPGELALARDAGWGFAGLGSNTLRAETAAAVGLGLFLCR
jgi:16S rRNA (uracil1498-N3)-methyltransferase